jgi:hypothetical protein
MVREGILAAGSGGVTPPAQAAPAARAKTPAPHLTVKSGSAGPALSTIRICATRPLAPFPDLREGSVNPAVAPHPVNSPEKSVVARHRDVHRPRESAPAAGAFPLRRVHLDFHTSPHIPDLGVDFDAAEFAATMKRAHVNAVTVFAKCHHGMCYFPTKTGTPHPALRGRDLLGEMITALHREGILAPIYTTVAWDEDVAHRFPAWRQVNADGTFARAGNADPTKPPHPGGWWFNDFCHPDYQDYLEEQVREISGRYPVDGFFFDILFYSPHAHHSDAARAVRAKHGLTAADEDSFRRFESAVQAQFCRRFTRLTRSLAPRATIFYNSIFDVMVEANTGARARSRHMTHFEVESLPSGFWGYYHFPRAARSAGRWQRHWLGMTGRFQKMWGDFGGIKPQPALEYECFRAQALGGGNTVGDQLPPRGRLDAREKVRGCR